MILFKQENVYAICFKLQLICKMQFFFVSWNRNSFALVGNKKQKSATVSFLVRNSTLVHNC